MTTRITRSRWKNHRDPAPPPRFALAEHLAELTGTRDREVLDRILVTALHDTLPLQFAAIYRLVGGAGALRWSTRARLTAGDTTPTADPPWTEFESLPRLDEHPLARDCLQRQDTITIPGIRPRTFFPLFTDREAVGVLEITTAAPLSAEDHRLAESILRLYRNVHGLLDDSDRDMLTGLLNRKTYDQTFSKTVAVLSPPCVTASDDRRAPLKDTGYWLGVLDIDHFKSVNDRFGHLIGDEVLVLLAQLLRGCLRYYDQVYRFGGEEFVTLIRCANSSHAAAVFERLRANAARHLFPQVNHLTVSIGFTEIRPGDTPVLAFGRADRAVYHAKTHGRDQVRYLADLVASGEASDDQKSGEIELF